MKHKKVLKILFIACVFGVISLPFAGMAWNETTEPIGNEKMAAFPSLDRDSAGEYLSDLGDWFEDHFAYRPELVTLDAKIKNALFGTSSQDSVITGSDSWLYYSATLDDFQHTDEVSDRELFNEAHNVALLEESVESTGAKFLFTIAPNKNTLCGEHMPERCQKIENEKSDFERLIPYLQSEGVSYVDLTGVLTDENGKGLYYQGDSHWNETGAVNVYNTLLDAAGTEYEDYGDVTPVSTDDYQGDLVQMLYPASEMAPVETQFHYLNESDETWTYENVATRPDEDRIETLNTQGSGSLLMWRDSFGNSLLKYFAQTYENALFVKTEPIDEADFQDTKRDLVIFEKVERHLPTLAEVPAQMTGARRDLDVSKAADHSDSDSTMAQQTIGTMLSITGSVDPSCIGKEGRIFVEVTDDTYSDVYEAFPVSTKDTDFGYQLYLDPASLQGDVQGIRVFAEQDDGSLALVLDESGGTPVKISQYENERQIAAKKAAEEKKKKEEEAAKKKAEELKKKQEEEAKKKAEEEKKKQEEEEAKKQEEEQAAAAKSQSKAQQSSQSTASGSSNTGSASAAPVQTQPDTSSAAASTEPAAPEPEPAPTTPAEPYIVSKTYIEDCGQDSGYYDILYSDGHHEYVDAQ